MKLFKNKFFLLIITIIFLLFSLQFYFISNSYKRDTNSYVTLVEWDWTLTTSTWKKVLEINLKEKLSNWDIINTLKNSLAIIEWWDKSITRLGWSSKVKVKENFVADDLSKINISFELLKWKTWSNVVSIMTWDSNFTQEIKWTSAAVRWTVFEANYEQNYLIVHKHEVSLTNTNWDIKKVYPWEVFSFKDFSLYKVIWKIDETFSKLNEKLDKAYLKTLREDFIKQMNSSNPFSLIKKFYDSDYKVYDMITSNNDIKSINNYISKLPEDKKKKALNTLQTLSQSLNFENWENSFLYNLKLNARWVLLNNSTDKNYNETLVRYSVYDLSDMFSLDKFNSEITKNTLSLISENKEYLSNNSDAIKELLNMDLSNFSPENIKNKILELNLKWEEIIHKWLDKILELYTK